MYSSTSAGQWPSATTATQAGYSRRPLTAPEDVAEGQNSALPILTFLVLSLHLSFTMSDISNKIAVGAMHLQVEKVSKGVE